MEAVAVTMSTILTEIGTFFTQAVTWVGNILELIATEPILLLMIVCMGVAGFVVGLVNRLIRL